MTDLQLRSMDCKPTPAAANFCISGAGQERDKMNSNYTINDYWIFFQLFNTIH